MNNLGIDLGNTVKGPTKEAYNEPFPNAFDIIKKLNSRFNNIFIISRVNDKQREGAISWFENIKFFDKTGIKPQNIYFCFDRRDKAVFVRGLNIDYFIDDRPEVMFHLPMHTNKLLFNPSKDSELINKIKNMSIVYNWLEIGAYFNV